MCVCLERVHQECGKHTSNEQINASQMFPHSWSRIQMVCGSVAVVGALQECGKHMRRNAENTLMNHLQLLIICFCGSTLAVT